MLVHVVMQLFLMVFLSGFVNFEYFCD